MKKIFVYIIICFIITTLAGCGGSVGVNNIALSKNAQIIKIGLYPAYIISDNRRVWGYIDRSGNFAIKPEFESASDFNENGVAIVSKNKKFGIINRSGEFIVEPTYSSTFKYREGYAIASDESNHDYVYDDQGKLVFEFLGYLHDFHEGLALAEDKDLKLYGFIDNTGKFKIKPQYKNAEDFKNGKAYVLTPDNKLFFIDKDGKMISEASSGSDNSLADNRIFYDGLRIRERKSEYSTFYGLYDKNGKEILSCDYCGIDRINDSIFAASKKINDYTMHRILPKALFEKSGKQLTSFIFYDIEDAGNKLLVSDKYSTYYLNYDGTAYAGFPKIKGSDSIETIDDLIKVTKYNDTEYYTWDGKIFWQQQNSFDLANGLKITENTYSMDRYLLIRYPQLEGFKNKDIQDSVNKQLKEDFMSPDNSDVIKNSQHTDFMNDAVYIDYSYTTNKNLLIISLGRYYNGFGAHGSYDCFSYHVDLTSGKFYTLGDLFMKGSDYKDVLEMIISDDINANQMHLFDKSPSVGYSIFFINKDNLQIFFNQDEIASHAAGPQTFDIPYSKISGLIDTESPFWKSFDKNIQPGNSPYNGKPGDISINMIKNIINRYEDKITGAISINDFSYVEPYLYPGSELYVSQKELVQTLSKQKIYEHFESADVLKTEKMNDTTVKAYVHEVISISNENSKSKKTEFDWIYTMKFSDLAGRYLLSGIEKWNI